MSRSINGQWVGRISRKAGQALRCCLAIYLVLHIVGTPIHLYLEPHSDRVNAKSSGTSVHVGLVIGSETHHSHSEHDPHSALQHDLQALRSERTPVADMAVVIVAECLPPLKEYSEEQVLLFSGLSPPELPRSWQFIFRTALPVRAPSFAS